jgi:phospholysine phosphohistidine inorganic pyrophosphate phosphatase
VACEVEVEDDRNITAMPPDRPSAYLIDLDGTLYAGGEAVPGAVPALSRLRSARIPFRLVTNTTSRSREMLVERLRGLGFDVGASDLFTATLAGAELAAAEGYRRAAPFLPEPAMPDLAGLELAGGTSGRSPPAGWRADMVVVGDLGARWSHGLMQEAFEHLMAGAALVALSRDRYWLKDGKLTLDAGPFVAGLEYASGRTAVVAGKPSPRFFRAALAALGHPPPSEVAMVGDDLWSDVAGAQAAGLRGWLVRTGKFRPETLRTGGITPDRVLGSVADLPA